MKVSMTVVAFKFIVFSRVDCEHSEKIYEISIFGMLTAALLK